MDGNLETAGQDAPAPRLSRNLSAPRALQMITRTCIREIRVNEPGFLQARSSEALHQLRVALRRWRAGLTVFRQVMPKQSKALSADLRWLARELNDARDLDVFAEALGQMAARDPALARHFESIKGVLDRMRADAFGRAAQALTSDRARRLLWEGARAADACAFALDAAAPSARALAAKSLSRRRRQIRKFGGDLRRLSPDERHQLRIGAKKARYAAELLGELFPRPALQRRTVKALKSMQDALGALNDIHVGEQLAARLAHQAGAPEAAFAAGVLAGARSTCDEAKLLKAASVAYDRFAALEPFW